MTEAQLHRTLVKHIRQRGRTRCWFHVPNGGGRDIIEGVNLKRMGTRAGVADLIFLKGGTMYALELKTEKGTMSQAQRDFMADCMIERGVYYVAYSLDDALMWLQINGLII